MAFYNEKWYGNNVKDWTMRSQVSFIEFRI